MVPVVTATIGLAVAALILFLIRKDRLHVRHGLGWMMVAASFALFGLFPGIVDAVAVRLGIGYPPILGLTIAFALLVIKILLSDIERSRLEMRNQRIIQRLAILESELQALKQGRETVRDGEQSPG